MTTTQAMPTTKPAEMTKSRAWATQYLSDAAHLPISFTYGGQAIKGIPSAWQPVARTHRIDANITETIYEGADPNTGLQIRVDCTQYFDYPVVEWVAWFTNRGQEDTPLLEDILALN